MCYVGKICKFFLLSVLFSFSLSAQTVTTGSGYPEIDLSALNPLGAVLSSADASARRSLMNQQSPSNTAYLGVGSSVSDHKGTWNAKMSVKFQVMRANHTGGTTDWASAYDWCKNYAGEGGGAGLWRLPTQRELIMIWILHPQLIGIEGFNAFSANNYWSATEYNSNYGWNMSFNNGNLGHPGKSNNPCFVRCIRDL